MSAAASHDAALRMIRNQIVDSVEATIAEIQRHSDHAQGVLTTICESQDLDGHSADPTATMMTIDEQLQRLKDHVVIAKRTLECATSTTVGYCAKQMTLSPEQCAEAKRKRLEEIEVARNSAEANPVVSYHNRADVFTQKTMQPGKVTRVVFGGKKGGTPSGERDSSTSEEEKIPEVERRIAAMSAAASSQIETAELSSPIEEPISVKALMDRASEFGITPKATPGIFENRKALVRSRSTTPNRQQSSQSQSSAQEPEPSMQPQPKAKKLLPKAPPSALAVKPPPAAMQANRPRDATLRSAPLPPVKAAPDALREQWAQEAATRPLVTQQADAKGHPIPPPDTRQRGARTREATPRGRAPAVSLSESSDSERSHSAPPEVDRRSTRDSSYSGSARSRDDHDNRGRSPGRSHSPGPISDSRSRSASRTRQNQLALRNRAENPEEAQRYATQMNPRLNPTRSRSLPRDTRERDTRSPSTPRPATQRTQSEAGRSNSPRDNQAGTCSENPWGSMSSGTQNQQIVAHQQANTQQSANRWSTMPLGHQTGPIGHSWRRHEDRMNDRLAYRELYGVRRKSENPALIARSVVLYGVPAAEEQEIWQRVNHLTRRGSDQLGALEDGRIECGGVNRTKESKLLMGIALFCCRNEDVAHEICAALTGQTGWRGHSMDARIADTGVLLSRDIRPGVNTPGTTRPAAQLLNCDSLIRDVDLGRVYIGTQPDQCEFCKRITRPPHKRGNCMVLQSLLTDWGGEYRCTKCHRVNHHLTEVCEVPEDWGLGDAIFQ